MTTSDDRAARHARNAAIIEEFRNTNGEVPSRPEMKILLLGTTGAKSGQARLNPVAYLPGDDRLYVFATKGGWPTHPDWYVNLAANPNVTVEVGAEKYDAIAETLTGPERDSVYARQVEVNPVFGEYQGRTPRVIPVVALRRA